MNLISQISIWLKGFWNWWIKSHLIEIPITDKNGKIIGHEIVSTVLMGDVFVPIEDIKEENKTSSDYKEV